MNAHIRLAPIFSAGLMPVAGLVLAFLTSISATYALRAYLCRRQILLSPTQDRWHSRPVPLFGGVAIYVSILFVSTILFRWNRQHVLLLTIASSMFAVGFVDDLFHLRAPVKLALQIGAAAALVVSGYHMAFTGMAGLDMAITMFLLLALTNSFNLLDNMDGLSAGIAIIVLLFRALFFINDGNTAMLSLTAVWIGGIAGFLVFNFNPASIFMGDSGSLLIGFGVGSLLIMSSHGEQATPSRNILYLILLAIPLFDTTFVTLTRKASGRNISQGGKDHLSHRLVRLGMSERKAVILLYALGIVAGTLSFVVYWTKAYLALAILGLAIVLFTTLFAIYLLKSDPSGEYEKASPKGLLPFLSQAMRNHSQVVQIVVDTACIVASYYAAYLLRFQKSELSAQIPNFLFSVFIVVPALLLFLALSGAFRSSWHRAGIPDYLNILKGVALGTVSAIFVMAFAFRFVFFSRSVLFINAFVLAFVLPATRASFKLFDQVINDLKDNTKAMRVLIYGAGVTGEILFRTLSLDRNQERRVVGFIDDDPRRIGDSLLGAKILGNARELSKIVEKERVQEILVASDRILPENIEWVKSVTKPLKIKAYRMATSFEPL